MLMSSQRMFRVGLALALTGLLFFIVVSPILNWGINQGNFGNLPLGIVGGLIYVIQQGTFFGGLFLLAGSFVARSAEEVAKEIRADIQSRAVGRRD